jgi:hypothetical protein
MDFNGTNGITEAGNGMAGIPLGFGFALAMNEPAMGAYAALSEADKEKLLMRCRDAKSKEEMRDIVNSLVTDKNSVGIAEEERETLQ